MNKILLRTLSWSIIIVFCVLAALWPLAFVVRAAIVKTSPGEEAITAAIRLSLLEAIGSAILATYGAVVLP